MKKLRPFLALLLSCWLLAAPALAVDEAGGAPNDTPSVSDAVGDSSPSSSETVSPPSQETPPSQDTPPEASGSVEFPSGDTPDTSKDTPPVVDDAPDIPDTGTADPKDPPPVVDDTPDTPEDPSPVIPDLPSDTLPDTPATFPGTPVDDPPVYIIPSEPLVPVELEVPVETVPEESHQVYSITTIPEFARAAFESDIGNTLSQTMQDLFGRYTPRVQTVTTYVDGELISVEEQYVPGVAGLDWEWLSGVAVFLILLYCLFRLLGGAVKYG